MKEQTSEKVKLIEKEKNSRISLIISLMDIEADITSAKSNGGLEN